LRCGAIRRDRPADIDETQLFAGPSAISTWHAQAGHREAISCDEQSRIGESITTIESMDSGPAPSKSAVANFDNLKCRTRVNPSSGGASRNDEEESSECAEELFQDGYAGPGYAKGVAGSTTVAGEA